MTALGDRIAALIASQGPISVAQFMTLALHDPTEGYYATHDPLGEGGDFITAPEVSQMFGELIGLWLAQCWHDQGKPGQPRLVELGPGRGTLMVDALRALKLMPAFRASLEVVLVEASPVLAAQQKEALAACGATVRWVESLAQIAADRPLFLVANEFFDALPIAQFIKTERGWCERMVTLDASGALAFALSPTPYPAANLPPNRDGAPPGGVYELCAAATAAVEDIARIIAAKGGAALIVDYGYDAPGFGETLQAVKRHRFAEVLADPGDSDLSAHVDFHALGDAAVRGGASVCGPREQGELLTSLGIIQRAQILDRGSSGAVRESRVADGRTALSEAGRLILPDQMGTLFKAMAIVPKAAPTPPGF